MDKFAADVTSWHDFYIMIGTAAATLIGLLFVALALNADLINRKENIGLRALAAQTFSSFISVLMFAVIFLIPDQGTLGLGLPLLGMDLLVIYMMTRRYLISRRSQPRSWGRGGLSRRFIIPVICLAALLIIAISILLGNTGSLYWLVPVMIMLIVDACINAWNLLLRLREPKEEILNIGKS